MVKGIYYVKEDLGLAKRSIKLSFENDISKLVYTQLSTSLKVHMTHQDLFEKCVIRSNQGKSIDCRLGLWGITSYSPESAEREARHYWKQYHQDGEYNQLLGTLK